MSRRSFAWLLAAPWLLTAVTLVALWLLSRARLITNPGVGIAVWMVGMFVIAGSSLALATILDVPGISRLREVFTVLGNLVAAIVVSAYAGFFALLATFGMA